MIDERGAAMIGDRVRWLLILAVLAALDAWSAYATWLLWTRPMAFDAGGGPLALHWGSDYYADGREVATVRDPITGVVSRTELRPATLSGRVDAAWPALLAMALTLLTLGLARTDRGWRMLRGMLPPRLSIRGTMIIVGVAGPALGLWLSGRFDPAILVDPAIGRPVFGFLALASLPAGLVLLYAHLAARTESPHDRP